MDSFKIETFRRNLQRHMDARGIGRKPLAKAAGLGETAIRDIFDEERRDLRLGTAIKLAQFFGVTLDEFCREVGQESTSRQTLGFIGLGVMGSGMCANLVRKQAAPVHVYDMNPDAIAQQAAAGALGALSVMDVAKSADMVFLSLPGGTQVAEVCADLSAHLKPGAVVVDLSTTGVAEARAVAAKLADRGILFADAPVARTRQAAIDGTLSIMVGASEALFARIAPLLGHMGSDVTHCGEVGCGQVVKLINNCLLFENVAAIAEMMVVAERAGVAAETLIEAVGLGSGNSFALQNHGRKAMAPREFPLRAFPSTYTLKDLGYAIDLAEQVGVEPRVARLAASYYARAVDEGFGEEYFPAIIRLVDEGKAP